MHTIQNTTLQGKQIQTEAVTFNDTALASNTLFSSSKQLDLPIPYSQCKSECTTLMGLISSAVKWANVD